MTDLITLEEEQYLLQIPNIPEEWDLQLEAIGYKVERSQDEQKITITHPNANRLTLEYQGPPNSEVGKELYHRCWVVHAHPGERLHRSSAWCYGMADVRHWIEVWMWGNDKMLGLQRRIELALQEMGLVYKGEVSLMDRVYLFSDDGIKLVKIRRAVTTASGYTREYTGGILYRPLSKKPWVLKFPMKRTIRYKTAKGMLKGAIRLATK